jgi:hypothetical protein
MKTLKLYEIVKINESLTDSILIELLIPYKNSLLTYYNSLFCSEPILMVTSVSNAAQYGKIVPIDDFDECLNAFIDGGENNFPYDNEDRQAEYETISFNSIPLRLL